VKKFPLLILFVTWVFSYASAQEDQLRLISSSHSRLNASTGNMVNYRPVYEHQGSTLSADSGYIYSDDLGRQYFDAFGKVIITQPNGTVIYADKLHYAAETRLATLTNNVRMVDDDAVLTTNHLTYNMKSSVGTYTGGGRIVNTTDTITSHNAYYFDHTKDAYFRHDVIVRTPNVKIYTDTMRYNSGTKMTYFYGPTNIRGQDDENLYTERGQYNTETEQAWFDSHNLYTQGSRFLRGDSLYYDGKSGNGRAVNNVVFIDTADQFFAYGGIGLYRRADESITMTKDPLVITVTRNDREKPDSTSGGDMRDSLVIDPVAQQPVRAADTAAGVITEPDSLRLDTSRVDSIYLTADTLFSQVIPLKSYIPIRFDLDREGGALLQDDAGEDFTLDDLDENSFTDNADDVGQPVSELAQPLHDSLAIQGDPLSRPMKSAIPLLTDTLAPVDTLAHAMGMPANISAEKKDKALLETHLKRIEAAPTVTDEVAANDLAADSALRAQAPIPVGGEADSLLAAAATAAGTKDTTSRNSPVTDTTTRIVKAYYNVRLFKSDLQAVADSVYYGYPDSMMRFFGRPMIWAQGSQLTADTIFMQIRNEQLDNMLMVRNAFLTNTQLDSSKFNQIKGRRITGFFANNTLERLFVDGNAESIYYNVDEKAQRFTDMYHNRSSRIKILVDSNAITHFIPISRVDGKVYPIHLIPQEAEILEGFVWKPGDRPTSKDDLLTRRRVPDGERSTTENPEDEPGESRGDTSAKVPAAKREEEVSPTTPPLKETEP